MQHCSCIEHWRLVDCQHLRRNTTTVMIEMLFNNKFQRILVLVGCVIFQMKIILALAEKQDWEGEYQKDKTEQKMFELFAEGIDDLTPKCWSLTSGARQLCGMRLQWNDDTTTLPPPTHPTKDDVHLDIFSNIRFWPKFYRCAFYRKTWRDSWEFWSKIIVFSDHELPHWLSMKSQESLDEDHYKHLVLG